MAQAKGRGGQRPVIRGYASIRTTVQVIEPVLDLIDLGARASAVDRAGCQ